MFISTLKEWIEEHQWTLCIDWTHVEKFFVQGTISNTESLTKKINKIKGNGRKSANFFFPLFPLIGWRSPLNHFHRTAKWWAYVAIHEIVCLSWNYGVFPQYVYVCARFYGVYLVCIRIEPAKHIHEMHAVHLKVFSISFYLYEMECIFIKQTKPIYYILHA